QATKTQLAEAQRRVKEFEDATTTEQEKLTERLSELEKEKDSATSQLIRLQVALVHAPEGMPAKEVARWAKRFSGSTREVLEADAAELFEGLKADGPRVPRRPKPDLRGGSDPTEDVGPDVKKVFDSIQL